MAMDSENIKGRAYAFGTFSAIKPRGSLLLRPLSWVLARTRARLESTHFAAWMILPAERAEQLSSSESELEHRRAYLLFLSAFNGDRDEYLHACCHALAPAIGAIWSHCERWPGASQLREFLEYTRAHELFADVFFNAYGDATAEDVRAALRLSHALEDFALAAPAPDVRHFRQRYERLLMELGADLAA
jgi:hypothetical protein